jgi:hypothetical protein
MRLCRDAISHRLDNGFHRLRKEPDFVERAAMGKLGHGSDLRCKTAVAPKAEVYPRSCHVAQEMQLFDHFVGEQLHRIGHLKIERPGRLQVDDEFEFSRL